MSIQVVILKAGTPPRPLLPEVIVISDSEDDEVVVLAEAEGDPHPANAESDAEDEPPFESKTGLTKQEILGVFETIRKKKEAKQEKEAEVAWSSNLKVVAAQKLEKSRKEMERSASRVKRGQGSSKSNVRVSIPDKREDGLLMIPPVSSLPKSTYWVGIPTNVHTDDAQRLDFVPYLGDISDNERDAFTDKLYEIYEETELMHLMYDFPRMNDDMFFELTVQLARKDEDRNRRVTFNSAGGGRHLKSAGDILKIRPSANLLLDMASLFKQLGTPEQILERFQDIVTKKSGGPKLDDPRVQLQSPEKTIDSYKTLYCNRCLIFGCSSHTKEDILRPGIKPISATDSFKCENPKCWRLSKPKPIPSTSRSKATGSSSSEVSSAGWNFHDMNIFAVLFQRYSDPCEMAPMFPNKTCRQVKEVMDRHRTVTVTTPLPVKEVKMESVAKPEVKNGKGKAKKKPKNRKISTFIRNSSLSFGKNVSSDSSKRYLPCDHEGDCSLDKNCGCVERGTPCEKFCTCSKDCKRRFPGCTCSAAQPCKTSVCLCSSANRECDPAKCNCCKGVDFHQDHPGTEVKCWNLSLTLKKDKHILKGVSDVSGWGMFAKEDIQDGEFITEFRGEILSQAEAQRRELMYDRNCHTFVFDLNNDFVIDAKLKGNPARYINSSRHPNCISKQMMVMGDHRLGIYANRFIKAGSELFYNYQHVLKRHQEMIKESKKSKKKKSK